MHAIAVFHDDDKSCTRQVNEYVGAALQPSRMRFAAAVYPVPTLDSGPGVVQHIRKFVCTTRRIIRPTCS